MQDPMQTDTDITAIFVKMVSYAGASPWSPHVAGHLCVLASAGTWQAKDCGMQLQMGGFNVLYCLQYTSSDAAILLRSMFCCMYGTT